MPDKKVILIMNTGYFGDVILTSKLTRDVKAYFPDKKIIYVCDTPYLSVARNLPGVDEVFGYNRKKDSYPFNFIKFIMKFPYRNKISCAFIAQNKKSRRFLTRILGVDKIIDWPTIQSNSAYNLFLKNNSKHLKTAYFDADMLSLLAGEYTDNKDIEFIIPPEVQEKVDNYIAQKQLKNLVAINPQAGDDWKCWKIEEFVDFVHKLINMGYTPVITGVSKDGMDYIEALNNDSEQYKNKILNLIDNTNFEELGAFYKRCNAVISVDTGSAHMACAVGTPTIMMFFKKGYSQYWAPVDDKKNSFIDEPQISADDVLTELNKILKIHASAKL